MVGWEVEGRSMLLTLSAGSSRHLGEVIVSQRMSVERFLKAVDDFAAWIDATPDAHKYVDTRAAVETLKRTVMDDFCIDWAGQRRPKRTVEEARLQRQLAYHKKQRQQVEEELAKARGEKIGFHVRPEIFVRVGLSDPSLNSRQLRGMLSLGGTPTISHVYAGKVRDAFAQLLKKFGQEQLIAAVSGAPLTQDGDVSPSIFINHVHDEASMRFRSYDRVDEEAAGLGVVLNRGRYSKVQNNAVTIKVGSGVAMDWMTELQPLSRKDGATLASAMIAVVKPVLDAVQAGVVAQSGKSARVIHMLVGDGVNTNESAAKRLLHHFVVQKAGGDRVQSRLMIWKCASHQANLVVLVAIAGRLVKDALESNELCGTLSRLYKYLAPSYLSEFTDQLRRIVLSSFKVHYDVDSEETKAHQEQTRKLVALYGEGVLPAELVNLRNRNLASMEVVSSVGCDEGRLRKAMFDVLLRLVWFVEEKPVVTRFFLFAPCCFALLRMFLLGLPSEVLSVGAMNPEAESSKRLKAVKSFYEHPSTPVVLRQQCLSLRLTLFATSLTAQKRRSCADKPDKEPMLVRLAKKEVQERSSALFADIVSRIDDDPVLDRTKAVCNLVLTQAHLVMRFDAYSRYPMQLWSLTRKFNMNGYAASIADFVLADDRFLDAGYSMPLKAEAWAAANGVEADAVGYLMQDRVQAEIVGFLENGSGSSLDVERKHQQDKRSETTKVTGCATASRNGILRRYLATRGSIVSEADAAKRRVKKAAHLNVRALAIEKNAEWFGRARGKFHWEKEVSESDRRKLVHVGEEARLKQYIETHKAELEEEIKARREAANLAHTVETAMPVTPEEWLRYIESNSEEFRNLLKTAEGERKVVSERVQAIPGLGSTARVYPSPCPEHGHSPQWSHLGAGFFCLRAAGGSGNFVCFVATIGYLVYACPLNSTEKHTEFDLLTRPLFHTAFRPIEVVLSEAGFGDQAVVFRLDIEVAEVRDDRIKVRMVGVDPVSPPRTQASDKAKSSVDAAVEGASLSEEAYASMMEKLETFEHANSDCASLVSSDESDSDDGGAAEEGSSAHPSSEGEETASMSKAAAGTHVVYSNGYFTFTDNRNYSDIRVSVLMRWCKPGLLGVSNRSKTIVPAHYGDERNNPVRSFLVLRAWMLHRAHVDGFCDKRASRRKVFAEETERLRADIAKTGNAVGTGNLAADKQIKLWAPQVLAVGR